MGVRPGASRMRIMRNSRFQPVKRKLLSKALPAVPAVLPERSFTRHARDKGFDFGGVAQLEEIGNKAFFTFQHDGIS